MKFLELPFYFPVFHCFSIYFDFFAVVLHDKKITSFKSQNTVAVFNYGKALKVLWHYGRLFQGHYNYTLQHIFAPFVYFSYCLSSFLLFVFWNLCVWVLFFVFTLFLVLFSICSVLPFSLDLFLSMFYSWDCCAIYVFSFCLFSHLYEFLLLLLLLVFIWWLAKLYCHLLNWSMNQWLNNILIKKNSFPMSALFHSQSASSGFPLCHTHFTSSSSRLTMTCKQSPTHFFCFCLLKYICLTFLSFSHSSPLATTILLQRAFQIFSKLPIKHVRPYIQNVQKVENDHMKLKTYRGKLFQLHCLNQYFSN